MDKDGHQGLRIGVKKGGCAGMEYTMDYVPRSTRMTRWSNRTARVMIAPMAQMFLFGTEIDYETSLLEAGFKFRNPNVTDACGCGESIKFKDVADHARRGFGRSRSGRGLGKARLAAFMTA
jgi:iron-sulfur cluster assembly protein